ncbi:MAG: hypothetical protein FJ284_08935, partial [Planctomycetes bacterium]|nr:hypothetical protein [Planctomycetota bacterium]
MLNTSHHRPSRPLPATARRGMLLLLVLSMLSLFLMMGTLAIVMATRARETSIAYAAVTAGVVNRSVLAKQLTNEALLMLLRGTKDTQAQTVLGGGQPYDTLLKDMYGTSNKAFVEEAYDAFDAANPFLTQVTLHNNGLVSTVPRPAFAVGTNAAAASVDNDGDGVPDGVWLPKDSPANASAVRLFPSLTTDDGNVLEFRASFLVLDLDSRINVNAHGRSASDTRGNTEPAGPADLDLKALVQEPAASLILRGNGGSLGEGWDDAKWLPLIAEQRRRPPDLPQQPVDGRFGGSDVTKTYDLRLDLEASRPSLLAGANTQSPFTLGELERVLRQYDHDASALPPRLAAVLGDRAERSRMRITTDNWETPGERENLNWVAPNSGANAEKDFHTRLSDRIQARCPTVPKDQLCQWLANVVDFRDLDNANTTFGAGVDGAEPVKDGEGMIPEGWNAGFFKSHAHLIGVPKGTPREIAGEVAKMKQGQPSRIISLVREYPEILEAVMVPSPFKATMTADPRREPARINVNTCDTSVWKR